MKTHLTFAMLLLSLFCLSGLQTFAQSNCTYTTTAAGGALQSASTYASVVRNGGPTCPATPSFTSTTYTLGTGETISVLRTDAKLVINGPVTLNNSLQLERTGSIVVNSGGSLTLPGNENTGTLILGDGQGAQTNNNFIVNNGGSVSVYRIEINKVDPIINFGGTVTTVCNVQFTNNVVLEVNGYLNINGNFNIGTGGGQVSLQGSGGSTPGPPLSGIRVRGTAYSSNGTFNNIIPSGSPLLVCVLRQNTGCPVPSSGSPIPLNNNANCRANVLPVTLVSFSADWLSQSRTVALRWTTATEKNNAGFEVQRSWDGAEFTTIGKVAGAGTSNAARHYEYSDAPATLASAYYRLKQLDYDGTAAYSPVVAVDVKSQFDEQWLIPTSKAGDYQIVAPLQTSARLLVVNSIGKVVYTQEVTTDNTTVALPTLPAGVYFMRLATKQGILTQRVLR